MTNLELISRIRKIDLLNVAMWGLGWGLNLWLLHGLIDPSKKTDSIVIMLCLIFMLIISLIQLLQDFNRLHKIRLRIDKSIDQLADEVMHVETIREKLKEELGNAAIDNTVHGAFFYGRQRILAKDCDVTCMHADFDDREFDMALIVKRKSTPIDEVLSAVHRAGRL